MKPIVLIYAKIAEESSQALLEALQKDFEIIRINPYENKNYLFSKKDYSLVINYGISAATKGVHKLNKASDVKTSLDKELTFTALKEKQIPSPSITKDYEVARQWIKEGRTVVVRKTTKGNNCTGIVFCDTLLQLGKYKDAPLYTRYIHHKEEYRINVWKGETLSIYKKINQGKHFKFELQKQNDPKLVELATKVYEAIPLDWVGIDVIKTEKGNYFVLETNSAPVLFPFTIKKLIEKLKQYINQLYPNE